MSGYCLRMGLPALTLWWSLESPKYVTFSMSLIHIAMAWSPYGWHIRDLVSSLIKCWMRSLLTITKPSSTRIPPVIGVEDYVKSFVKALVLRQLTRSGGRSITGGGGGGHIFMYSCSAQLYNFFWNLLFLPSVNTNIYVPPPPQLSIFRRLCS